jgi:DNA repair ATPase RecN
VHRGFSKPSRRQNNNYATKRGPESQVALRSSHEEYVVPENPNSKNPSRICWIQATNLAGIVGSNSSHVRVTFGKDSKLIAVTGNSASGKSLLLAKTVDLLCGAKASASLVEASERQDAEPPSANVQIQIHLGQTHLSGVVEAFQTIGLDTSALVQDGKLILERTLLLVPPGSRSSSRRLKSVCSINQQSVSLKDMASLARPLLVVVDASTAAMALAKPEARLAMIDMGVHPRLLQEYHTARRSYKLCRRRREQLQEELSSRTVSKLYSDKDGEKDNELLGHYIEELNAMETRMNSFCKELPGENDVPSSTSMLVSMCRELAITKWSDNMAGEGEPFRSAMLDRLVALRDCIQSIERQTESAYQALDSISSLSLKQSAISSIEEARKRLYGAAYKRKDQQSPVDNAAEKAHEMLNSIESSLLECARFIEDDDQGVIRSLELERSSCLVSSDQLDGIVGDWGSMARKHGVMSYQLPSCHAHLKHERDGNVEARKLLPKAIADEGKALDAYERMSGELSRARLLVARKLEKDVTEKLPSLSMEKSLFCVDIRNFLAVTDRTVYEGTTFVDSINFLLLPESASNKNKGGPVYDVASSGEKARLLLAMECSLPGSVGAVRGSINLMGSLVSVPPVAVVYDEIDAHVGGTAANTLASMLATQSETEQVVAITHSPSVGALADLHLVVKKLYQTKIDSTDQTSKTTVDVAEVSGAARRSELARMASGDLAMTEAEAFADALIRESAIRRGITRS